jgi:hypothetical protein
VTDSALIAAKEEAMSTEVVPADVYHLKGSDIELTYRRGDGNLDVNFADADHSSFGRDGVDVNETVAEDGLHLTATLLESTRSGMGILLTVLLPDVRWAPSTSPTTEDVTGVAAVTSTYEHTVGGPRPVLHSYSDPWHLEGTASPAG